MVLGLTAGAGQGAGNSRNRNARDDVRLAGVGWKRARRKLRNPSKEQGDVKRMGRTWDYADKGR